MCDAFAQRDFTITQSKRYKNVACVLIMGVEADFTIIEGTKRIKLTEDEKKKTFGNYKYEPKGQLTLKISNPYHKMKEQKSWSDGKTNKLEKTK